MRRSIRITALFTTALAACTQVIDSSQHTEVFCQEKGKDISLFSADLRPGDKLAFAVSTWTSGLNFAVFGEASKTDESRWRYEDGMTSSDPNERCAVDITRAPDQGYTLVFDRIARCASMGGHGITPPQLSFPASIRQANVTDKILQPDLFMNIGHCAPR